MMQCYFYNIYKIKILHSGASFGSPKVIMLARRSIARVFGHHRGGRVRHLHVPAIPGCKAVPLLDRAPHLVPGAPHSRLFSCWLRILASSNQGQTTLGGAPKMGPSGGRGDSQHVKRSVFFKRNRRFQSRNHVLEAFRPPFTHRKCDSMDSTLSIGGS